MWVANKIWTVMISTKSAMVTVLQSVCVNVIIFHASKKKKRKIMNKVLAVSSAQQIGIMKIPKIIYSRSESNVALTSLRENLLNEYFSRNRSVNSK